MLIGVVGKPSTGKSTFFKAATLAEVETANYPFTTIKPNHAVGYVKIDCVDKEFEVQCNPRMGYCLNHKRFVPIDLLDVAGLVPGASEGAGMGNQFLDVLNQANALIHVIDVSGSMGAQNKLPLLKSAFKLLVNQLRAQDKVAIVVYAGAAGVVLQPTSGKYKEKS